MWKLSAAALVACALAWPAAGRAQPEADQAELARRLKPVDRAQVYEFAQPPTMKRLSADRYEIHFAAKADCDVAVAVENAAGRIVRYVGYGVLGPNAPAPFKADSLEQTLVWDGKDQFGKYVRDAASHKVRVSLGLNPTFDRVIAWHPKNPSAGRHVAAVAADPDGVYVLETCSYNQLRQYDHDGRYVRTLYPYDPGRLDKIDVPRRDLPDARKTPAGQKPPVLCSFGATVPFGAIANTNCMAVAAGRMGFYTRGGLGDNRRLLRLNTDGTTPPEGMEGAPMGAASQVWGGSATAGQRVPITFESPCHIAMSPDGKWVYIVGLSMAKSRWQHDMRSERPPYCWNAVFRFAYDKIEKTYVVNHQAFIGEVSNGKAAGAGSDAAHLNNPQGLATDAAGNLYVCDYGNNRIQVFSAEGGTAKLIRSIPIEQPNEIAVHQKTGEIYVMCYKYARESAPTQRLVKLGPLSDPKVRFELTIPGPRGDMRFLAYTPTMGLDSWSTPTRLWLTCRRGELRAYDDTGSAFKPAFDFRDQVEKDGFSFAVMTGNKMGYIVADPTGSDLYRGSGKCKPWVRMDAEEGKTWTTLRLANGRLGEFEEVHCGLDGLLYARHLKYIARFDPKRIKELGNQFSPAAEVPFDYGELLDRGGGGRYNGVLNVNWALGGANGFNNGVAVAPNGDVLALVENYTSIADFRGQNGMGGDTLLKKFQAEVGEDRFRPRMYAGRKYSSGYMVWRWDHRGEVTGEDLIPGLELRSSGIRADKDGNVYVGVGYHQNVDEKIHIGGALAKFPPDGGKLVNTDGTPKLTEQELPRRSPDYFDYSKGNRIWAYDMFWSYPGLDQIFYVDPNGTNYTCHCNVCKFDTDPYGRSFVPKAYAFCVGVVDANGNRICEIGRYGNPDAPAMTPGGTDIGLAECSFLTTVPDRWLYLNDDANLRIIRLKLGYRAEQSVAVPE